MKTLKIIGTLGLMSLSWIAGALTVRHIVSNTIIKYFPCAVDAMLDDCDCLMHGFRGTPAERIEGGLIYTFFKH